MQKLYFYQDSINPEISFNYLISTPENFDKNQNLPLIVWLHGAGERGIDIEMIKYLGIPKYFDKISPVKAITLSPQCADGKVWNSQVYELKRLIDTVVDEYNVDKSNISISGASMGGFGTWEMGVTFPGFFSKLAPICGGGMSWRAPAIGKTPVRAYHGDIDETVEPMYSEVMVNAINRNGGNAELIMYKGVNHDAWTPAFEKSNLIEWLIKK